MAVHECISPYYRFFIVFLYVNTSDKPERKLNKALRNRLISKNNVSTILILKLSSCRGSEGAQILVFSKQHTVVVVVVIDT